MRSCPFITKRICSCNRRSTKAWVPPCWRHLRLESQWSEPTLELLRKWLLERPSLCPSAIPAPWRRAFVELLKNSRRRESLALAAQDFARTYNADWTVAQFEGLYRRIVVRSASIAQSRASANRTGSQVECKEVTCRSRNRQNLSDSGIDNNLTIS